MRQPSPEVTLSTAGHEHGGWKAIRISMGMDSLCSAFELQVSELWPGQPAPRRIQPGEPCQVNIGKETVISGYVDEVSISYAKNEHTVTVKGRDKTADLIDCSAVWKTGQWKAQTILQIAEDICGPYGIEVTTQVDVGKPVPLFALQPGESVFEALHRLATVRALLMVSDSAGRLVFTRAAAGKVETKLVLGENVLAGVGSLSMRDRYSEYIALGQVAGTDFVQGKMASQVFAKASDAAVKRNRTLVLFPGQQDAAARLRDYVQFEANVRAARAMSVEYTIQGWTHSQGLWRPNTLVPVRDEFLGLDCELLLFGVNLELSERGTLASLALTRPEAFDLAPPEHLPKWRSGDRFVWD